MSLTQNLNYEFYIAYCWVGKILTKILPLQILSQYLFLF